MDGWRMEQMNRVMNGTNKQRWNNGLMKEQINGWVGGRTTEQRWTNGLMKGQINEWMGGWTNEWSNEWNK